MGTLKEVATGRVARLAARNLVGRSRHADICLEGHWVSGEHAVITWTGRGWQVRDLGSRNGTTVDGRRLKVGAEQGLRVGARIAFGQVEDAWILDDPADPQPFGVSAHGAIQVAQDGVLVLPDEAHAWATIERRGAEWTLRDLHGTRTILDGDTLALGGVVWRVRLPELFQGTGETPARIALSQIRLRVQVSQDGETVDAELTHQGQRIGLTARAHHVVLVELARAFAADEAEVGRVAERGWMYADELAEMLKITRERLNTHVARLRGQVIEAGVVDGERIIERRALSGQIRLAPLDLVVDELGPSPARSTRRDP